MPAVDPPIGPVVIIDVQLDPEARRAEMRGPVEVPHFEDHGNQVRTGHTSSMPRILTVSSR